MPPGRSSPSCRGRRAGAGKLSAALRVVSATRPRSLPIQPSAGNSSLRSRNPSSRRGSPRFEMRTTRTAHHALAVLRRAQPPRAGQRRKRVVHAEGLRRGGAQGAWPHRPRSRLERARAAHGQGQAAGGAKPGQRIGLVSLAEAGVSDETARPRLPFPPSWLLDLGLEAASPTGEPWRLALLQVALLGHLEERGDRLRPLE